MPVEAFIEAGYSAQYFEDLKQIVHDEEEHVILLTDALKTAGAEPVAACQYKFPYTDVRGFITLSSVLEGVGTSAYLGAAGLISSKDNLGVAASILVTEALHTSQQRSAADLVAAANPYGTALGANAVFTLATAFISSCPSTNVALNLKPFPVLALAQGLPAAPGISFEFLASGSLPDTFFVVFVNGLDTIAVESTGPGPKVAVNIPEKVQGQAYVFITSAKPNPKIAEATILHGPAIIEVTPPAPTFDLALER